MTPDIHTLDAIEKDSIRRFVERWAPKYLTGDVLDYGCGRQPYRSVVDEVGGSYHPFDRVQFGGNVSGGNVGPDPRVGGYDAILCTQVVQYVPAVQLLPTVARWASYLRPGGVLVMTYPTTWPEIRDDLHRFTRLGMESILGAGGFRVLRHEQRAAVPGLGVELPLGYGVVATPAGT